jgi:hypothetical protein
MCHVSSQSVRGFGFGFDKGQSLMFPAEGATHSALQCTTAHACVKRKVHLHEVSVGQLAAVNYIQSVDGLIAVMQPAAICTVWILILDIAENWE